MTKKTLAFTATTALFALGMMPGAIMNIVQPDFVLEMTEVLGIPAALLTLMGVWKLLGLTALAAPGLDRVLGSRLDQVREWAYAGFFFDLSGAAYLHGAAGDYPGVAPSLVLLGVLVASYLLRPGTSAQASSATRAGLEPARA